MKANCVSVSVIVPIYNVENYIERCAISLLEQTLDDIEFIFVDDNSPDKSVEILRNVLQRYPSRLEKVKIVHHNENLGLAMARETGFRHSSGSYIIHCDSDDWVDKEMYEAMYRTAKNEQADIVVCDYIAEYARKSICFPQNCATETEKFVCQLLSGQLHNAVWNKLVSRDLYLQVPFLWKAGCNMWEDVSVIPRLAFYANQISYIPKGFYHYSQINNNSYTKRASLSSITSMLEASQILINFFENKNGVYMTALMYLKLSTKYEILSIATFYNQVNNYRLLYSDANALIFNHPTLPMYKKFLLWLWIHSFDKMALIFFKSVIYIKTILRR